jgi:quercetin dioxygenase-like cupin family protein
VDLTFASVLPRAILANVESSSPARKSGDPLSCRSHHDKGPDAMNVNDPETTPREQWRPGVETRMLVSARNGASQLCIFEQWVAPGNGAPTHSHPVEEALTVLQGEAEMWLDHERAVVRAGQSMIVPAGRLQRLDRAAGTGTNLRRRRWRLCDLSLRREGRKELPQHRILQLRRRADQAHRRLFRRRLSTRCFRAPARKLSRNIQAIAGAVLPSVDSVRRQDADPD